MAFICLLKAYLVSNSFKRAGFMAAATVTLGFLMTISTPFVLKSHDRALTNPTGEVNPFVPMIAVCDWSRRSTVTLGSSESVKHWP